MISALSLRLLYLIFPQILGLVMLLGHVLHQGHRAPRAAPRGRRAPAQQPETTPGVGGPSRVRRARPAAAQSAALPASGHAEHDPALASAPRAPEVDLSEPGRPPTDRRRRRRSGATDGAGEPK